jgi:hypothetical protein
LSKSTAHPEDDGLVFMHESRGQVHEPVWDGTMAEQLAKPTGAEWPAQLQMTDPGYPQTVRNKEKFARPGQHALRGHLKFQNINRKAQRGG